MVVCMRVREQVCVCVYVSKINKLTSVAGVGAPTPNAEPTTFTNSSPKGSHRTANLNILKHA